MRQGTAALLAPGSVIADQYREYAGRVEGSFRLTWQSGRSPQDFAASPVSVELDNNRQVRATFPPEVWADGTTTQANGVTTFTVTNVIRQAEATQLNAATLSGSGAALQLVVIDLAGQSNLVSTQFRVKLRTSDSGGDRGRPLLRTRYDGAVPANLVTRDGNRFVIALGQLPISARDLAPGVRIDVELTATRSFAERSAEQTLEKRGEIRR